MVLRTVVLGGLALASGVAGDRRTVSRKTAPGLNVTVAGPTWLEQTTTVVKFHLTTEPAANVVVQPTVNANELVLSSGASSFNFTNSDWSDAQSFTATMQRTSSGGFNDDNALASLINFELTSTAPGYCSGGTVDATVTHTWLSDPEVIVSEPFRYYIDERGQYSNGSMILPEGQTEFAVRLSRPPSSDVIFTPKVTDTARARTRNCDAADVDACTAFTFTSSNWDVSQTVTVTAIDNDNAEGWIELLVDLGLTDSSEGAFDDKNSMDVLIRIKDDEMAAIVRSPELNASSTPVVLGSEDETLAMPNKREFMLASQPFGAVTITPAVDTGAVEVVVTPPALVFTPGNWNQAKSFEFAPGASDGYLDGDVVSTVTYDVNVTDVRDNIYTSVGIASEKLITVDAEINAADYAQLVNISYTGNATVDKQDTVAHPADVNATHISKDDGEDFGWKVLNVKLKYHSTTEDVTLNVACQAHTVLGTDYTRLEFLEATGGVTTADDKNYLTNATIGGGRPIYAIKSALVLHFPANTARNDNLTTQMIYVRAVKDDFYWGEDSTSNLVATAVGYAKTVSSATVPFNVSDNTTVAIAVDAPLTSLSEYGSYQTVSEVGVYDYKTVTFGLSKNLTAKPLAAVVLTAVCPSGAKMTTTAGDASPSAANIDLSFTAASWESSELQTIYIAADNSDANGNTSAFNMTWSTASSFSGYNGLTGFVEFTVEEDLCDYITWDAESDPMQPIISPGYSEGGSSDNFNVSSALTLKSTPAGAITGDAYWIVDVFFYVKDYGSSYGAGTEVYDQLNITAANKGGTQALGSTLTGFPNDNRRFGPTYSVWALFDGKGVTNGFAEYQNLKCWRKLVEITESESFSGITAAPNTIPMDEWVSIAVYEITVTLSGSMKGAGDALVNATIDLSNSPSVFITPVSQVFLPTSSTLDFQVFIGADGLYTGGTRDETVTVRATAEGAEIGTATAVVTIRDREVPVSSTCDNTNLDEKDTPTRTCTFTLDDLTYMTNSDSLVVTLSMPLGSPAEVVGSNEMTFTNSQTTQTYQVRAVDDDYDIKPGTTSDNYTVIFSQPSATVGGSSVGTLAESAIPVLTTADDEVASINMSLATTAGTVLNEAPASTALQYNMQLTSKPECDVTVTTYLYDSAGTRQGVAGAREQGLNVTDSVVFEAANWNDVKIIEVGVLDDDYYDRTSVLELQVAAVVADSCNDLSYEAAFAAGTLPILRSPATDFSITFTDNQSLREEASVSVTGNANVTECGSQETFSVVLTSKPYEPVEITYSLSDRSQAGFVVSADCPDDGSGLCSQGVLSFTDSSWNSALQFTVQGVDDDIDDDAMPFTIVLTTSSADVNYTEASNPVPDKVGYNINDGDTAGITVEPIELQFAGRRQQAMFRVHLETQPTAAVILNVASTNSVLQAMPSRLTFAPASWNAAGTITVVATNDENYNVSGSTEQTENITISSVESMDPLYAGLDPMPLDVSASFRHRTTEYMTRLEPATFEEFQEVRLELRTYDRAPNGGLTEVPYFNVRDRSSLHLATFAHEASLGTDCEKYAAAARTPQFSTTEFGLPATHGPYTNDDGPTFVPAAYATFTAGPSTTPFIVCFKHIMTDEPYFIKSKNNGKWQTVATGGANRNETALTANRARLYYNIPAPTAGQYAIVQMLADTTAANTSAWNFTLPASTCARVDADCRDGDNFKIVPAGMPCTYEYWARGMDYYGSDKVDAAGKWTAVADGWFKEGATPGGVGAFGSQLANPLVDDWTSVRTADYVNGNQATVAPEGYNMTAQHVYVYVRLPRQVGSYDVCYSNQERRKTLAANSNSYEMPMWTKVRACERAMGMCNPDGAAVSFDVVAEKVGWTMLDFTPGTFGDIVFDDSGEGDLNNAAQTNVPTGAGVNQTEPTTSDTAPSYWAPAGGDMYRIVPASMLREAWMRNPRLDGPFKNYSRVVRMGSMPMVGCWARAYDTVADVSGMPAGGYDGQAQHPLASIDLRGDPTSQSRAATTEDTAGLKAAFASVFLPRKGTQWHVCYRRTCTVGACAEHSGMRVLPYHNAADGAPPAHWLHLQDRYAHGSRMGPAMSPAHKLVPGRYYAGDMRPVDLQWYAPPTPTNSWAPVHVSMRDVNETRRLDVRLWNFHRDYSLTPGDRVTATVGSAVRLVRNSLSCDYPDFHEDLRNDTEDLGGEVDAAQSIDGGMPECDNAGAFVNGYACAGSSSDRTDLVNATYFMRYPSAAHQYSVCYRQGGMNWRKLPAVHFNGSVLVDWTKLWTDPFEKTYSGVHGVDSKEYADNTAPAYAYDYDIPDGSYEYNAAFSGNVTDINAGSWPDFSGLAGGGYGADYASYPNYAPAGADLDFHGTEYAVQGRGAQEEALYTYTHNPDPYRYNYGYNYTSDSADYKSPWAETGATEEYDYNSFTDGNFTTVYNASVYDTGMIIDHAGVIAQAETELLQPLPASGLVLQSFTERRAGFEALIVVQDTESRLSSAARGRCMPPRSCVDSGDVLRVVPRFEPCDINPKEWMPTDTDARVGMYSADPTGSGMIAAVAGTRLADSKYFNTSSPYVPAWAKNAPPLFDDIAPGSEDFGNRSSVSAGVVLPHIRKGRSPVHKVCYKRAGESHWAMFNVTLETGTLSIRPRPLSHKLIAGERKTFTVTAAEELTIATLHAKFVYWRPSWTTEINKACQAGVPAGTEGEIGGSSVKLDPAPVDTDTNSSVTFTLTVPHRPGHYALCVQLKTPDNSVQAEGSWWRPGDTTKPSFEVVDNGVRWFVTPGNRPTNLGLSTIGLVRCAPLPDGGCSYVANRDFFNTDAGVDAAKIVTPDAKCDDNAVHVGVRSNPKGVDDLGPADGAADVASFRVTLPAVANDAETRYKVCVRTLVNGAGFRAMPRWFEVRQAAHLPGQDVVTDPSMGGSGFRTAMAHVRGWSVAAGLRPANSELSGTGFVQDNVALAGASTNYVANPGADVQPDIPASGFSLMTYVAPAPAAAVSSASELKLVLATTAEGMMPSDPDAAAAWGNVDNWAQSGADCSSPSVPSARGAALTDVASGTFYASFHVPQQPGGYFVCYRTAPSEPWLALPGAGGESLLYSHPNYMRMSWDRSAGNEVLRVFDYRTLASYSGDGTRIGAASWCKPAASTDTNAGADCSAQAFEYDLLTVVNGTQVCPAPRVAPAGSNVLGEWFQLERQTNTTAAVSDTAFQLPPAKKTPSGLYKICVYKAGSADASANVSSVAVTKKGVVYQLHNQGSVQTGGGTDYWREPSAAPPSSLRVTSTLAAQESRFMGWTADLQDRFESTPAENVTTGGQLSRSVLVESGATVEYMVEVYSSSSNEVVDYGYFVVEVARCSPAGESWPALECSSYMAPSAGGSFALLNVDGQCRADASASAYGWLADGLRQYTTAGRVSFALQYRSRCAPDAFGCGVRFTGVEVGSSDGSVILSPAQWVNVQQRVPDGMLVDGRRVATSVHTPAAGCVEGSPDDGVLLSCYRKTCMTGEPCVIEVQATSKGAKEFAPLGNVAVYYSEMDYADYSATAQPAAVLDMFGSSFGGQPLFLESLWADGGLQTYTLQPELKGGMQSGRVYVNLTHNAGWARIVIDVVRAQLSDVSVSDISSLDVKLGLTEARTPVPNPDLDTAMVPPQVTMFLEALVPYEARLLPVDAAGTPLPRTRGMLTGWALEALIEDAPDGNRILRVEPDAASNTATTPALLAGVLVKTFADSDTSPTQRFRVYVIDGVCSRFGTNGGCTLVFKYVRNSEVVTARVRTAVRVPASTLKVSVTAQGAPGTTSKVRHGLQVEVIPGTYIVSPTNVRNFVNDEYHYGSVFALLDGIAPSNGVTDRDGLFVHGDTTRAFGCAYPHKEDEPCDIPAYPTMQVASGMWGAEWTMRPNQPCNRCKFTFHTTWGAGPESYAAASSGDAVLTWEQDDIKLACSASPSTVVFFTDKTMSQTFSITVRAEVNEEPGVSAVYPRWWVYADVNGTDFKDIKTQQPPRDYTLLQDGRPLSLLSARMGAGALATFTGLSVMGPVPENVDVNEEFSLTLLSRGLVYGSDEEGASRAMAQVDYTCTVQPIAVRREEATVVVEPVTSIRLVGVDSVSSATALCDEPDDESCGKYVVTDRSLAENGVTFVVEFVNTTAGVAGTKLDTSVPRNLTVVPTGGQSTPKNRAPTWTYEAATRTYTSAGMTLDSAFHLTATRDKVGGSDEEYTFGSLAVVAERTEASADVRATVPQGRGSLSLRYDPMSVAQSPVREATFRLCESKFQGDAEVTNSAMCVAIHLWVVPEAPVRQTVMWAAPEPGTITAGVGAACGEGQASTVSVVSYYEVSGADLKRFYVYDMPLTYTLTTTGGAQQLLSVGGGAATSLMLNNSVPVGKGLQHSLTGEELRVSFTFFGVMTVPSDTLSLSVSAVSRTGADEAVGSVASSGTYKWDPPTETYARWSLSDAVTVDPECPQKRHLQSIDRSYRTYTLGVGQGWSYATGVHVGMPFPVETIVRRTDNMQARSFTPSLVKVTKRSWSGCNNGGNLGVYSMNPSPVAADSMPVAGDLLTSWTLEASGAVRTEQGVGTAWPVFDAPCQSCTLELQLCYTTGTAESCLLDLGSGSTDPSDQVPLYPDRTRITKPFSVQRHVVAEMGVYEQRVPKMSETGTISVGDLFQVNVENVQLYGAGTRWAIREPLGSKWARSVSVMTKYIGTASMMTYSNGGFLADGAERAARAPPSGCSAALSPDEFALAARDQRLLESASGQLNFYFARPCAKCEVHMRYTVMPPAGEVGVPSATGAFPLRHYAMHTPQDIMTFAVTTCARKWMLAGVPAPAVRKRASFSLTVIRTDSFNFPAVPVAGDVATFTKLAGNGNGGGGRLVVTSPVLRVSDVSGGAVGAVMGSATARFSFQRACLACGVSMGGQRHHTTVLADPTRVIAIPEDPYKGRRLITPGAAVEASWSFEVYAADEYGDRSYTVAGPTAQALHPLYNTPFKSGVGSAPGTLTASASGVPFVPNAVFARGLDGATTITMGSPSPEVTVTAGQTVYNGIPMPGLAGGTELPGSARIKVTAPALMGVSFQMSPAGVLPTSHAGGKMSPRVALSVAPTAMAVDAPPTTSVNGELTFHAYAVGRLPTATAAAAPWYVAAFPQSSRDEAAATATINCGDCGSGEVTPRTSFADGMAMFGARVQVTSAEPCPCNITVTPPAALATPPANATAQSFSVSFAPTTAPQAALWKWQASDTLPGDFSVFNRTVTLSAKVHDTDGVRFPVAASSSSRMWELTFTASSVQPAGCFVCRAGEEAGTCASTYSSGPGGYTIEIEGYFPKAQTCTVGEGSFTGLPEIDGAGLSGPGPRSVVVEAPTKIEMLMMGPGTTKADLPLLIGRTLEGQPAAVAGLGTSVTVRVVAADGTDATGDNHMMVTLEGSNAAGGTYTAEAVARNGMATFMLDLPVTRSAACENITAPPVGDQADCPHDPWTLSVSAKAQLSTGAMRTFETITGIGPLYVVRRAVRVEAFAKIGHPCDANTTCVTIPAEADEYVREVMHLANEGWRHLGADEEARWMFGAPIDAIVGFALDLQGRVVTHPEDMGSYMRMQFDPVAVPCRNIDAGDAREWIRGTCIDNVGACRPGSIETLPTCSLSESSGWQLQAPYAEVQMGRFEMANVAYGRKGLSARPGPTHFALSTEGLNHPVELGAEARPSMDMLFAPVVDTFPFSIDFQETAGLRPVVEENEQVTCVSPGGRVSCALPDIEPGVFFQFDVAVVDAMEQVVASDSQSNVTVSALCASDRQGSLLVHDNMGALEYVARPAFNVRRGVARVFNVSFTNVCERMQLTVACTSVAGNACAGKSLTLEMGVKFADGSTLAPLPETEVTISCFVMGEADLAVGAEDQGVIADLRAGKEDFEASILAVMADNDVLGAVVRKVTLDYACSLPADSCITDDVRVDSSTCVDMTLTPAPDVAGNGTDNGTVVTNGTDVDREFDVLQTSVGQVAVEFTLTSSAPVDVAETGQLAVAAIQGDLASPTSSLKKNAIFENADASSAGTVVEETPVPPVQPVETTAPPAPVPTTVAPVVSTKPPETGSPSTTSTPVSPPPFTLPPNMAAAPAGPTHSMLLALLCTLAALFL